MKKIINPWRNHPEYNCFGCCPENPIGLHMEFYEDGDYIGIPKRTIRDGWQVRNLVYINAEIVNSKGELCNEGEAIYFLMNQEKAKEMGFQHCEVEGKNE